MKVLQKMGRISPVDAGEQLGNVACPALIVQGSADPDWVAPASRGRSDRRRPARRPRPLAMIDGAGHYPHVQFPAETLAAVLPFLAASPRAGGSRA